MHVEELFSDSDTGEEAEDAEWLPVKPGKGAKKAVIGVRSGYLWLVLPWESLACVLTDLVCVQRNCETVASPPLF